MNRRFPCTTKKENGAARRAGVGPPAKQEKPAGGVNGRRRTSGGGGGTWEGLRKRPREWPRLANHPNDVLVMGKGCMLPKVGSILRPGLNQGNALNALGGGFGERGGEWFFPAQRPLSGTKKRPGGKKKKRDDFCGQGKKRGGSRV